ncbi:KH domain-containing protein [bacterium]|nr:KH domain-containing protein [bacterium]
MKDLVTYIVKAIVENSEAVNIEESVLADGKIILTIHTAPTDVGLVIGKMGKTINAIRSLVKIKAIKEGKFVDVKVPSDRDNGNGGMGGSSAPSQSTQPTQTDDAVAAMPTETSPAVTGEFEVPNF